MVRLIIAAVSVLALALISGCKSESGPSAPLSSKAPATPVSASPAPSTSPKLEVTDSLIEQLLRAEYPYNPGGSDPVRLAKTWNRRREQGESRHTFSHKVCLKERENEITYVAVCASTDEGGHVTAGMIDLFAFGVRDGKPVLLGSEKEITSNGFGTPSDPAWVKIGPNKHALVLSSGYTSTGETSAQETWYGFSEDSFDVLLVYPTVHSYDSGVCGEDSGAANCNAFDRTCKVEFLRSKPVDRNGHWPVVMHSSYTPYQGKSVPKKLQLKPEGPGFEFSDKQAVALGCIQI